MSDTYFTYPASWTDDPLDSAEPYGGGDSGDSVDKTLVSNALGTLTANKVGESTSAKYWVASRNYLYSNSKSFSWQGRYIQGSLTTQAMYTYLNTYYQSNFGWFSVRPIIRLKPGLTYSGSGTSSNPYTLS